MRENRIVFEITDLTHVRLICTNCKGTTLCGLDNGLAPPAKCPSCRTGWWPDPPGESIEPVAVLKALRALRRAQEWDQEQPVKLQLEFLDDKD